MITRLIQAIVFTVAVASAEDTSLTKRISQRSFPSVFQAWNDATPTAAADVPTMQALHDLVFLHPSVMGLNSGTTCEGMAFEFAPADIAKAREKRATLVTENPQLVLLAEIRYRDAPKGFLPEDAPDHLHDWYAFWDKGLGRPLRPGVKRADGGWEREFASGTVIHNPAGGASIQVRFDEPRQSRTTGLTASEHRINANDGDIFLHQ